MKKMYYLITLTIVMVLSSISLFAQNMDDVLYLKNGSVIRGIIIEQVPNESLKIQTYDGNIFVYKMEEVLKITKESPIVQRKIGGAKKGDFNKPDGYFGLLEIGYATPTRLGVTVINGYRIVPQFAIGVGIGLQGYIGYGEMTIPLFVHLRSDFLNRAVSPFIAFNIGYNISVLGGYYGGLMMEPTLGVSFNVGASKKNRMTVGLGAAFDKISWYDRSYLDGEYYSALTVGFNLKVGFSF